jgi:hypothetical protein
MIFFIEFIVFLLYYSIKKEVALKSITLILTLSLLTILNGYTLPEVINLRELDYDEANWDDYDRLFVSKRNIFEFSERGKTLVMLFFHAVVC